MRKAAAHQPGGTGGDHHEGADQQHPHRLDRDGHHHRQQHDEQESVAAGGHPARDGERFIEGEQNLAAPSEEQIGAGADEQQQDQAEVEPRHAQDVAEQQVFDPAPVAAHPAQHQHRQGEGRGIHDVQQRIGREAAAAGQPVDTKGEEHRKGHQHHGGIETQQDAGGDAQQGGMAEGVAEEGELAQHRETAEHPAQGTGE